MRLPIVPLVPLLLLASLGPTRSPQDPDRPGWRKGVGWGWIWGEDDELGALNHMRDGTRLEALKLVTQGRVYDLGVTYSRDSYRWPGHSPGEIMSFRSPEGVKRAGDLPFTLPEVNSAGVAWHSCALFINDNVATQIDGLGHLVSGEDDHWYNGFTEREHGGDFGLRRCSAAGIPPIVNRAVLLDIAGQKGVDALPGGYAITPADLERAMERQGVRPRVGDIVLLRTGTLGHWGADGSDHEALAAHDSAGASLETARYLVEELGALAVGSDTSGFEVSPPHEGATSFIPCHEYLLVQQGVHILEFHDLQALARDQVWEFCYVALTNKIAGTTAGFTLRPIALR